MINKLFIKKCKELINECSQSNTPLINSISSGSKNEDVEIEEACLKASIREHLKPLFLLNNVDFASQEQIVETAFQKITKNLKMGIVKGFSH